MNSLKDFRKILKYQNFLRVNAAGAELFHAGQMDMTNLEVVFRNFANTSQNVLLVPKQCLQCISVWQHEKFKSISPHR